MLHSILQLTPSNFRTGQIRKRWISLIWKFNGRYSNWSLIFGGFLAFVWLGCNPNFTGAFRAGVGSLPFFSFPLGF